MGTGTDVAIESGGVTLLKGDHRGLVRARALSRAPTKNVRRNLFVDRPTPSESGPWLFPGSAVGLEIGPQRLLGSGPAA